VNNCDAGASGNVLIDKNANRVNSYNVWNYAEENDSSYSKSMLVDLTQPAEQVGDVNRQSLTLPVTAIETDAVITLQRTTRVLYRLPTLSVVF